MAGEPLPMNFLESGIVLTHVDGGRAAEGRRGRWQNGMENVVGRSKNVDWAAVHKRWKDCTWTQSGLFETFSNFLFRKYFFTNAVGSLDKNVVVRQGL